MSTKLKGQAQLGARPRPERAQRLLQKELVPPVLHVERSREREMLMLAIAMAAAGSGWPLIVSFDGRAGTRYAGINLVVEVLS